MKLQDMLIRTDQNMQLVMFMKKEQLIKDTFFILDMVSQLKWHQILYGVENQKLYMVQLDLMLSWEPDTQQLLL